MELLLNITGVLLILLAVMHIFFARYFRWKQEMVSVSLINRQMMYIHALFIGLGIFLMGLLCITSSAELFTTVIGKRVSLGLGIFWFVRLVIQFFGYSSELWRGKRFETGAHIVLSVLWVYVSSVFLMAGLGF